MRRGLAAAVAVTLTLAGCGGDDAAEGKNAKNFSGDQKEVAQVIDDLAAASREGDVERICTEIFTPALAETIGKSTGTSCSALVEKQLVRKDEEIVIRKLAVQTPNAEAEVREQDGKVSRLTLFKEDGVWRIDGVD